MAILVNGAPIEQYRYTPGEIVDLIVRVADPDQGRWGFQVTARSAADGCRSEGALATTNEQEVSVRGGVPVGPCDGPQYATHSFPKTGPGSQEFAVRWTAPAEDVGPIVFAAAGNAANGNNLSTGDRIYTTSTEVQPASGEPPPTPSIGEGGVVLATLVPTVTGAAPNAILSVFGQEFAPEGTAVLTPSLDDEGRVSTELAGVCVEIGGQRSPLFAVLPNQLNLQASEQAGLGPQAVTVIRACGQANEVRSAPEMVDFADVAPGFFVFANFGGEDGANPIAALHGGGPNVVAPEGLFEDNEQQTFSPAAPGEFVSLFATGLGLILDDQGEVEVSAGEIPNRTLSVTRAVRVSIGGVELPPYDPADPGDIFYVGVAPCCAGLYQLVVRIPATLEPGQHEAIITVDGVASPPGPFIPVE